MLLIMLSELICTREQIQQQIALAEEEYKFKLEKKQESLSS